MLLPASLTKALLGALFSARTPKQLPHSSQSTLPSLSLGLFEMVCTAARMGLVATTAFGSTSTVSVWRVFGIL